MKYLIQTRRKFTLCKQRLKTVWKGFVSLQEKTQQRYLILNRKKGSNKRTAESYENAKICYICKKKFKDKHAKDKKSRKVRDHCHYTGEYRGTAYSICNLKYSLPKEIYIVFHNGCNYDHHFIIKELPEGFKK